MDTTAPDHPGPHPALGLYDDPNIDSLLLLAQLFQTGAPTLPGLNAVWLAPDACLMPSHRPTPEGEPDVVHVVGVADCSELTGWVLMLD